MTLLSVIHQGVSEASSKVSRFLGFAFFLSGSDPGLEDMPDNTLVHSFKNISSFYICIPIYEMKTLCV